MPAETEWLEFKRNRYRPQEIGEYLSALANSASLIGQPCGYLLFGIDNQAHDVVGTKFDPYSTKGKGNQDLIPWIAAGLQPKPFLAVYIVDDLVKSRGKGVFLFSALMISTSYKTENLGFRLFTNASTMKYRVEQSKSLLDESKKAKERPSGLEAWIKELDWTACLCVSAQIGLDISGVLLNPE